MGSVAKHLLAGLLLSALLVDAARAAGPQIVTEAGTIEGVVTGDVVAFKGIPYAAPPVGPLRWKAPQPVAPWSGVRVASDYGNDCVQFVLPNDAGASGSTRGEDCLVLHVWRPATPPPGQTLPVLVWIHGGGFLNGAASVPFLDGSAFARDGVICVSMNYRLGRLGFFAHPALRAERDPPDVNFALLDQLAALRWVRKNIAAFGGDPERVTLAGESAGGLAVVHFLTWPAARGLFQRAAVMSGGGRNWLLPLRRLDEPVGTLPSAEASGIALAESLGVRDRGRAGLDSLRAVPVTRVNGDMSMLALLTRPPNYAGGPIVDGHVIIADPESLMARGTFEAVPLIVGTVADELSLLRDPRLSAAPLAAFGEDAERARALYDSSGTMPADQLARQVGADLLMHEPARFLAGETTKRGKPAWLYRFEYVTDSVRRRVPKTPHAGELPYLFDQLDARYRYVSARDRQVARAFHGYVVNFVKAGDPNGGGLPPWPAFDEPRREMLRMTPEGAPRAETDPWDERLRLLQRSVAQ